ncbi:MAG: sensor histidine kinase [Magnetococcales bacterium]|nr:sensor histidine kinase [Magnetococcales bacterium]
MNGNPSLHKRLAWGLGWVLIGVLTVQWVVVTLAIRHVTQEYLLSRLTHDAEHLFALLEWSPEGAARLSADRVDPIYLRPWSGHYYLVRVGEGVLRSRSLWNGELRVDDRGAPGEDGVALGIGPHAQPVLMLTKTQVLRQRTVRITVAERVSQLEEQVRLLQIAHGGISLLAILLLLLLQRHWLRRALRPLELAREEVERLESGVSQALPETGIPGEVLPLVKEINRLVSVMRRRLERSRQAAGNMAHAIRTPLTVIQQWIGGEELDSHPQLREKIFGQIAAIRSLTGRELKKVRMAGSDGASARVAIGAELSTLVEVIGRVHQARGLYIESRIPEASLVWVDREDLLELGGNLLDNACKWARARVRFTVRCDEGMLVMLVEDDGPGCDPAEFPCILERGGRADAATRGYGIGLSVVNEIVADYGGSLELGAPGELPGFRVRISLPLKGARG